MSNNSVEKYMDLIKISMTMTNLVEKNKIIDEAHKVLSNSKPNTGYNSNNNIMYQTNVYCGPGNAISQTGNTFGPVGYNLPNFC